MPADGGWGLKVNELRPFSPSVKASESAVARASQLVDTATLRKLVCESFLVRRILMEIADLIRCGFSHWRMPGAFFPLRSEAARAALYKRRPRACSVLVVLTDGSVCTMRGVTPLMTPIVFW